MENNQREITHKILKPELWFLSGHEIVSKLIKNTQARVMVLVHDTSSCRGLQVYQVSSKNL